MIGRVTSTKMEKTVSVIVESRKTHPLYKKTYAWSKRYLAHDEMGAQMGDIVRIVKSRPISKRKHWMVVKILGRDIVPMSEEALKAEAEEMIAEVMPEEKEQQVESAVEVKAELAKETEVKKAKAPKAEKPKKEAKEVTGQAEETKVTKATKETLPSKEAKAKKGAKK